MAHYDCTTCGEPMGISADLCHRCKKDSTPVNIDLPYEAPFAVIGRIAHAPGGLLGHGAAADRFQLIGTCGTRDAAKTMARNWVMSSASGENRTAKIMRSVLTITMTRELKETPDAES